ncbi:hypothetical protein BDV97DRAFT_344071 [Delphinella strobiligena]|nr:hypothetical protein BDV97DRAFT_344071 [Delphinella strobiligena]
MPPLIEAFPPWQLATRVNLTSEGKVRKDYTATGEPARVELEKCKLKELLQYDCHLKGPVGSPRSVVVCAPVVRLFRACAGGLIVETTAWEGVFDSKAEREGP